MQFVKTFLLELIKKATQIIIDIAMSPENIEKYKMAYRQIWSDTAIEAPKAGKADEELKDKVKESGMENIPLPSEFKP